MAFSDRKNRKRPPSRDQRLKNRNEKKRKLDEARALACSSSSSDSETGSETDSELKTKQQQAKCNDPLLTHFNPEDTDRTPCTRFFYHDKKQSNFQQSSNYFLLNSNDDYTSCIGKLCKDIIKLELISNEELKNLLLEENGSNSRVIINTHVLQKIVNHYLETGKKIDINSITTDDDKSNSPLTYQQISQLRHALNDRNQRHEDTNHQSYLKPTPFS